MFDGLTVEVEDMRKDNGEKRITCYGQIAGRMAADVISRWRATGPGWQTRMAECLARAHVARVGCET